MIKLLFSIPREWNSTQSPELSYKSYVFAVNNFLRLLQKKWIDNPSPWLTLKKLHEYGHTHAKGYYARSINFMNAANRDRGFSAGSKK